jgi:hypothetical protein
MDLTFDERCVRSIGMDSSALPFTTPYRTKCGCWHDMPGDANGVEKSIVAEDEPSTPAATSVLCVMVD